MGIIFEGGDGIEIKAKHSNKFGGAEDDELDPYGREIESKN